MLGALGRALEPTGSWAQEAAVSRYGRQMARSLFDRIRSVFLADPTGPQDEKRSAATPAAVEPALPASDGGQPPDSSPTLPSRPRGFYSMGDAEFERHLATERAKDARYEPTTESLPRSRLLSKAAEAATVRVDEAGLPNVHLVEVNSQLALAVPDGRLVDRKATSLYRYDLFLVAVRGTGHYVDANLQATTTAGTVLGLRRDPDNAHDSNALAVIDPVTGSQLGWVNKLNASRLAKRLDGGEEFRVLSLCGSPKGKVGDPLVILVTRPDLLDHLRMATPGSAADAPLGQVEEEWVRTDPAVRAEDRWRAGTPPVHGLAKQSHKAPEIAEVRAGQLLRVERVEKQWFVYNADGLTLGALRWRLIDSGKLDRRLGAPMVYPDRGVLHVTRLLQANGVVVDFGGYVDPE